MKDDGQPATQNNLLEQGDFNDTNFINLGFLAIDAIFRPIKIALLLLLTLAPASLAVYGYQSGNDLLLYLGSLIALAPVTALLVDFISSAKRDKQ